MVNSHLICLLSEGGVKYLTCVVDQSTSIVIDYYFKFLSLCEFVSWVVFLPSPRNTTSLVSPSHEQLLMGRVVG